MTEGYKTYIHNPPHLFRPNAKYFITGSTLHKKHYFDTPEKKANIVRYMLKSFQHYGWNVEDWVLLDNHYHAMADADDDPSTLPQVINNFHRFSSLWLKKHGANNTLGKVWHNYWDTCITYESSYFARIHYIWYNPVKHGYVSDPGDWEFGSYYYRNRDETEKITSKYPCDQLKIKDDF